MTERHGRAGYWRIASLSASLLGLASAVGATSALAQAPAEAAGQVAAPAAEVPAGWTRATTVFVKVVFGSRTDGSAKRINETHAAMQAQGWRYMSLESYVENGDLVGFFVTYVK